MYCRPPTVHHGNVRCSVDRQSQTVSRVWESEFGCVVCFLRVCYFRRILVDLPIELVNVYSS